VAKAPIFFRKKWYIFVISLEYNSLLHKERPLKQRKLLTKKAFSVNHVGSKNREQLLEPKNSFENALGYSWRCKFFTTTHDRKLGIWYICIPNLSIFCRSLKWKKLVHICSYWPFLTFYGHSICFVQLSRFDMLDKEKPGNRTRYDCVCLLLFVVFEHAEHGKNLEEAKFWRH
jgi:hypothetical protein